MSRNPVGSAIPSSEYDGEFVVASINAFINNLEVINNVILNNLANQNLAPCQLIKKRAENKRLTINTSNIQLKEQHSGNSGIGQPQTLRQIQSCSTRSEIQSTFSQKNIAAITKSKKS